MMKQNFTRVAGLLAMLTGAALATGQEDKNALEPDVTVTATFFHTTLTITDWPASIPTPGPPAANPTGVVAADVQQDKNASPELTVTATFGDIIYTITDWPSTIPTPDITVPPNEAVVQAIETETPVVDARDIEERDYVTTSSYMDTTTQTWVVPATTLSGPSSTVTFSAITWTNTWTRLVTTHITLPGEPPKMTMNTVVKGTATPSKRHGSSFPPHSQVTQAN
ncbi:hypothetical protein LQW54_003413 [Pestalotiopsis sp. IQ-011]